MIVALDCDGVICDWLGGVLETVFELTGKQIDRNSMTSWNPWEHCGLTKPQRRLVLEEMKRPGWHEYLKLLPGARDAVAELRRVSEVVVVTAPWDSCDTWHTERKKWLWRNLGLKRMIAAAGEDKYLVAADYFLDDKASNVISWAKYTSNYADNAYLLDAPYNRDTNDFFAQRVCSLQQFVDIVKSGAKAA